MFLTVREGVYNYWKEKVEMNPVLDCNLSNSMNSWFLIWMLNRLKYGYIHTYIHIYISQMCPLREPNSNDTSKAVSTLNTQSLVYKHYYPQIKARAPWRNVWWLGQETFKMNLYYLAVPNVRNVFKKWWGYFKWTQESTWRVSYWPNL